MQNPLKGWGKKKISSHPVFWKMDPVLFLWHWLMLVSVAQRDVVMEELFRLKLHLLISERLRAWCHTPVRLLVWREGSAMVCGRTKSHGNESNAEWRGCSKVEPSLWYSGWQPGVAAPLSRCRVKQQLLLSVAGSNRTKFGWRCGKRELYGMR